MYYGLYKCTFKIKSTPFLLNILICCVYFRLFSSYKNGSSPYTDWSLVLYAPYVDQQDVYEQLLDDLEPDVKYHFRVDIRQLVNDKVSAYILLGEVSEEVFIPCTGMQIKGCKKYMYCMDILI